MARAARPQLVLSVAVAAAGVLAVLTAAPPPGGVQAREVRLTE